MKSYYKTIIIEDREEVDKSNTWFQYDNNSLLETFFGHKKKSKLQNYKFLLESEIALANDKRNELLEIFNRTQRVYHGFSLLAKIWKYKHAKVYNSEDLYLNPINENTPNVVVILQNNWKYLFPIMEIVKSMNQNLMNSPYFFAEPLSCKNPYTNIPLSKSQLYNVFFRLRQSPYLMPILIYRFFLADFNIHRFSVENNGLIREMYLKNYVRNIGKRYIFDIVNEMLKYHNVHKKIRIHKDFPSDLLSEIMRPYVKLYYDSLYNINNSLRHELSMKLHYKLSRLIKYNPNFGRKKVSLVSNSENPFKKKQKIISYNSDAPQFEIINKEQFMNNHDEKFKEHFTVDLPESTRYYLENNIHPHRANMNNEYIEIHRRMIEDDPDDPDEEDGEVVYNFSDNDDDDDETQNEENDGLFNDNNNENTDNLWNEQLLVTLRGLNLYDADEESNTDEMESEL